MIKQRLIRKSRTTDNITDITRAYNSLSENKGSIIHPCDGIHTSDVKHLFFQLTNNLFFITLTGIPTANVIDLNFQLTNNLFNTINADYRSSYEYINYLFVIEYGGTISKSNVSNLFLRNLGLHAHCIVDTSLSQKQLDFYINTAFKKIPNYQIQDISQSTTKPALLNYLLKQNNTGLMTKDSYNYKIWV